MPGTSDDDRPRFDISKATYYTPVSYEDLSDITGLEVKTLYNNSERFPDPLPTGTRVKHWRLGEWYESWYGPGSGDFLPGSPARARRDGHGGGSEGGQEGQGGP